MNAVPEVRKCRTGTGGSVWGTQRSLPSGTDFWGETGGTVCILDEEGGLECDAEQKDLGRPGRRSSPWLSSREGGAGGGEAWEPDCEGLVSQVGNGEQGVRGKF